MWVQATLAHKFIAERIQANPRAQVLHRATAHKVRTPGPHKFAHKFAHKMRAYTLASRLFANPHIYRERERRDIYRERQIERERYGEREGGGENLSLIHI